MHIPVLLKEVLEYLPQKPGLKVLDATVSHGGHALAVLEKYPDSSVLGIEWDPELAKNLKNKVQELKLADRFIVVSGSYTGMADIAKQNNFQPDAILFDLGLSSWHYEESGRGFSFKKDEILDMRFSPEEGGLTAADIVNKYDDHQIEEILREYGEEQFAHEIAKSILWHRKQAPIVSVNELVNVIEEAVPGWYKHKKINCATKTFQALRIAVNGELDNVRTGIREALELLKPEGRLLVIAFHGGEDKIVKDFLKHEAKEGTIKFIEKKAIQAEWEEKKGNPRSRSAKMRVVEKV